MVEGPFKKVPGQCVGFCPLDDDSRQGYPLIFTRNCPGPSVSADHVDQKATLSREGGITITPADEILVPTVACRNAGVTESLRALATAHSIDYEG